MTDTVPKRVRSKIMTAVRSTGNETTEGRLISFFRVHKIYGWKRKSNLFGKPDFVFRDKKIAIFADGCFWHGHTCRNVSPKTNKEFWATKIKRNKARDTKVKAKLRSMGWCVFRIWECAITEGRISSRLLRMLTATNSELMRAGNNFCGVPR